MRVPLVRDSLGTYMKASAVNVNIGIGNFEISIAIDNSAGAFDQPKRSNLIVFDCDDNNINKEVFGHSQTVDSAPDAIVKAITWCQNKTKTNKLKNETIEAIHEIVFPHLMDTMFSGGADRDIVVDGLQAWPGLSNLSDEQLLEELACIADGTKGEAYDLLQDAKAELAR